MELEIFLGQRILVVDDDQIFHEMVHSFLSQKSVILQYASILKDAEKVLADNDFDLILLDNYLPDGFGVQLIPFLQPNRLTIPVLIISSDDNQATKQKCFFAWC